MNFKDKIMMREVFYLVILTLVMSMVPMLITGCSGTPGYIAETLTLRDINFSFEYPVDYEKSESSNDEVDDELDYVVLQYIAMTDDAMNRKVISIQLWNPTEDWPTAKAKMDSYAASLQNLGQNPEISERSPLRVAGVDGEKLVFSVVMEEVTDIPNYLKGWVTAFDYRGQIFFIAVTTNIEPTDEVEADYVHLIESFKLLD